MAFTLSGSIITQTGTDTSLAGISAIAGVITTTRVGGFTTYDLGVLQLRVSGNLSIGTEIAAFEQLIIGQNAGPSTTPDIDVLNGGVLNIGHQYTSESVVDSVTSQTLIYEPGANKGFDESNGFTTGSAFLRVNSGGTLNWFSGVINIWGGVVTSPGSNLNIGFSGMTRKPVLDYMRVYRNGEGAQQWYSQGNTNINGLVWLGGRKDAAPRSGSGLSQLSVPTVLTGIDFKFVFAGFIGSSLMSAGTYTFSNIGDIGIRFLFSVGATTSAAIVEFLNYEKGSNFFIAYATAGRSNTIRATKNYIVQTKNIVGANISSVVYVIGKSGTQKILLSSSGSTPTDKFLLRQAVYTSATPTESYFSKNNNNTDLIDIYSLNYAYEIISQQNFELKGIGTKTTLLEHKFDTNVTLSEVDAVAKLASSFLVDSVANTITVTANSTLDDLYDAMKAWKTRNVQAQLEYPTIATQPVTANGNTLSTAMSIIINSGVTLSNGVKFKNITTSGTFTSAGVLSANVTANVIITGTITSGVIVTGNLSYNTNIPTNVTLINSTITGILSNIGTATVTVINNGSTIGTIGARITQQLAAILSINMASGTFVYVTNAIGEQQLYQVSSGSIITLDVTGATGTWGVKLAQYGKISQSFTFNPSSGGTFSYSPTLIPDTNVVDTLNNVLAYTNLNTTQKIYDYYSYYGTTNTGIAIGSVIFKGFGTLTVPSGLILDPAAANLLTITSNVVTTKTSGLSESVSIISSGDFTQNNAMLSNDVIIRSGNFDSEIFYNSDSITFFPSVSDRDSNTNAGVTSSTGIYRYKYAATYSGVTMMGTLYFNLQDGNTKISPPGIALVIGKNAIDISTQGQLSSIKQDLKLTAKQSSLAVVYQGLKEVSKFKTPKTDL